MDQLSLEEKVLIPKTTTHFLPKFENADASKRFETNENDSCVLCVSKKHSGSLVMAPPFYAKNSTRNRFSRLPALLLQDHFACCWPAEEAQKKFSEWWHDAEENLLSYSFETVAPRVLGDHGATPKGAYLVLTAIAKEDQMLSPAQVLQLATKWKLPLNETLFIQTSNPAALALENALHQERWTMDNFDADQLLSQVDAGVMQYFLRHEDVQGSILEGFVLFKLKYNVSLVELAAEYTKVMAPFRESALACAVAWGAKCLTDASTLGTLLDDKLGNYFYPPEPESHSMKDIWNLVCNSGPDQSSLRAMFNTLCLHYKHLITLKTYMYKGRLQVQIRVNSDEIFYSWPLHMRINNCAPLFRGHIVTFFSLADLDKIASDYFTVQDDVKIMDICKLKCVKYLVRTFGIRNRINSTLATQGTAPEITIQNFCNNWRIPEQYRPEISSLLMDWSNFVAREQLSTADLLEDGHYLHILEPFLARRDARLGTNWAPDTQIYHESKNKEAVLLPSGYGLVIADMRGDVDLSPYVIGLRQIKGRNPKPGYYLYLNKPPPLHWLQEYDWIIILVLGPNSQSNRQSHMWSRFLREFHTELRNTRLILDVNDYCARLNTLPALPTPKLVPIVATYGLCPGSGKSTLLSKIAERLPSFKIVSSDEIRRQLGVVPRQQNAEFQRQFKMAILNTGNSVGYDKNIPDVYGLHALRRAAEDVDFLDLRLLLIAPRRIDRKIAWSRIQARDPSHIGLTASVENAHQIFSESFADKCEASLAAIDSNTDGIIRSDAFWEDSLQAIDELADSLVDILLYQKEQLPKLNTLIASLSLANISETDGPPWLSLDIKDTNLHCTLVPPDVADTTEARSRFLSTTARDVSIVFNRFVVACSDKPQNLRVAFWEVSIEGLGNDFNHYAPQAAIYHVTDVAALQGASKPKHAADAMRQRRAVGTSVHHWRFVVDIDLSSHSLPPCAPARLCLHGRA